MSAGHNPALLRRASGALEQIKATGVPIGMFPNASWKEGVYSMLPGDLLCVYSDGITEALDAADEEFGLDRFSREIGDRRTLPVRQISDEVLASVADFARGVPQYDDQTLLFVRRT